RCDAALTIRRPLRRCRLRRCRLWRRPLWRPRLYSGLRRLVADLHVVEQAALCGGQHVLPPGVSRVALGSIDECAVVIGMDGLATCGIRVVTRTAVDLVS